MSRYTTGGGGGGAGSSLSGSVWDGMIKQSPLETETDYFEAGSSLDAKWEEWDISSDLTVTQAGGSVLLTQASSADDNFSGIIQDCPASPDDQFCITARFRLSSRYGASSAIASLIVGEDLSAAGGNAATADFFNCTLTHNASGIFFESTAYQSHTAYASVIGTEDAPAPHVSYLRWFCDRDAGVSGEVTAMASVDGRTWVFFPPRALTGTVVGALESMGIAALNLNTGHDVKLYCDMFRVDITTDPHFAVGALY